MLKYLHIPIVSVVVTLTACAVCGCIPNTHHYDDNDYSDYDYDSTDPYAEVSSTTTYDESSHDEEMSDEEYEYYSLVVRANKVISQLEECVRRDDYTNWDSLIKEYESIRVRLDELFDSSDYDQSEAMSRLNEHVDNLNNMLSNLPVEAEADSAEIYYGY